MFILMLDSWKEDMWYNKGYVEEVKNTGYLEEVEKIGLTNPPPLPPLNKKGFTCLRGGEQWCDSNMKKDKYLISEYVQFDVKYEESLVVHHPLAWPQT